MGADAGTLRLYQNLGDGCFEDVTESAGLQDMPERTSGGLFFDADGDDDLDLLVTFYLEQPARYYEQQEGRFFFRAGAVPEASAMSMSASCADLDADGLPEVSLTHWFGQRLLTAGSVSPSAQSMLLGNRGGHFEDIGADFGLVANDFPFSFTSNFVDLDRDGNVDLLVASDFGQSRVALQGDAGFSVRSDGLTDEHGMGAAIGDFDNDGDMDWFVTSIWAPEGVANQVGTGNRLYSNDGLGHLTDVSERAGVRVGHWGWGACAADFDNDGWLDIYQVNGFGLMGRSEYAAYLDDPSLLFMGAADGQFQELAKAAGVAGTGQGRGVACGDFDRDGDVDVLVTNADSGPQLLENTSRTSNTSLSLRLRSASANTRAIGARVRVSTGKLTQLREIRCGNNYLSQDPYAVHIGLGRAEQADQVEVEWPSGERVLLRDVPAGSQLELREPGFD
jgi:hypothetical protein